MECRHCARRIAAAWIDRRGMRATEGIAVKDDDAAERLKALGHPVRLAIVRALAERSCCCCADVCSRLPLAQSTVSQHLKVLKDAGLVSFRRDGVRSSYVLNPAAFAALAFRSRGDRRARRQRAERAAAVAEAGVMAERTRRKSRPTAAARFPTLWNLWPYMWPADRPDLKLRVLIAFVALARRQGRRRAGALFVQMGDRRADRARAAPPSFVPLLHRRRRWRWCSPTMSGASSRPASRSSATRSSRASASTRCGSSPTGPSCICTTSRCASIWSGAPAACRASSSAARPASRTIVRHVILNTAPTVLEFALTAGDRLVPVRLLVRRRDRGDRLALCLVHGPRQRLADHHPPRDERFRHRRAFQGDRTRCSTTRRSNISATSSARRSASTARWRATSARRCAPGRRSPG